MIKKVIYIVVIGKKNISTLLLYVRIYKYIVTLGKRWSLYISRIKGVKHQVIVADPYES